MTVLIAGCGDLGTEVGLRLAARGERVVGLRRSPERIPAGIEGVAADMTRPLPPLPPDTDVVIIATAAGDRSEAAYRSAYVDSTQNVLDALERDGLHPGASCSSPPPPCTGISMEDWSPRSRRRRVPHPRRG